VVATEIQENTVRQLIEKGDYTLSSGVCDSICSRYCLPAVSFFMDLKNYQTSFFQAKREETAEQQLERDYLHMCVAKYHIDAWQHLDDKKVIKPVIKDLELTV